MKNDSPEQPRYVPQGDWKPVARAFKPTEKKYMVQTDIVGDGEESAIIVNCRIELFKIQITFGQGIDLDKFLMADAESGHIYVLENNIYQPFCTPAELLRAMCIARPEERSMHCREKNPALKDCATDCPFWEALDNGSVQNVEESVDSTTGKTTLTMILKVTLRGRYERLFGYTPCRACGQMIRDVYGEKESKSD